MEKQFPANGFKCSLLRSSDGTFFIRRYTTDYEIISDDIEIIICDPHIVFREDHEKKFFSIDDSDDVLGR